MPSAKPAYDSEESWKHRQFDPTEWEALVHRLRHELRPFYPDKSAVSLNHTKWDCKYHVVFIPKNRRKVLYAELRVHLKEVFRSLALQKDSRIEEGHLMVDQGCPASRHKDRRR